MIVAPDAAYATNSNEAVLYRLPLGADGSLPAPEDVEILELSGDWQQVEGFNANGIVATPDGGTLIVVSGGTGALYRIDVASREVSAIDVAQALPGGDGLILDGQRLYVVQNGADRVAVVELAADFGSGEVTGFIDDERLSSSATAALVGDRLLVVNAQFAAMQGTPTLPFTVSVLPAQPGGTAP